MFEIQINIGAYHYRFQVEQSKPLKGFELFTLTGGDKKVVLQSNRPMLLARGLKRKPIYWKVIDGDVKDQKVLEKVIQTIEQYLKEKEEKDLPPKPVKKEPYSPPSFAKSRKQQAKMVPRIPWGSG